MKGPVESSEVKTALVLAEDPKFNSQNLHGGPQSSITPVLGDLNPSFDLYGH